MPKSPDPDRVQILHYPAPQLRKPANLVDKVDTYHREMAARMDELLREAVGVGLAANQVGWLERVVVINLTCEPGKSEIYINPRIVARTGEVKDDEGCLSLPGVRGKVVRASEVTVSAIRLDGQPVEIKATGLLARAWQHEMDHLEGMLFVDRLGAASKFVLGSRLRKLEKEFDRQGPSGDAGPNGGND
jgi:peptide deformylase